jgi:hypothetical protein
MKATLWKLIHKWRDATTTESAWIARDQIDIELDEIDELRAALVERDAEIVKLMDVNRTLVAKANRQNIHDARQAETIAAQRKVLEQAMEALSYLKVEIIDGWDARNQQHLRDKAITAIQEVLA